MMKFSNYLTWFRRLLILGAVVAGATASTAAAVGRPDVLERYAAAHPYGAASAPDVLERYAAAHPYGTPSTPDVVDRYATAHPFGHEIGVGSSTTAPVADRMVDDSFRDKPSVTAPQPTAVSGISSDAITRHFDHEDALFGNRPVPSALPDIATSRSGFDWGDWAIGIGTGLGLALLLGVGLVMSRQLRQRIQTA